MPSKYGDKLPIPKDPSVRIKNVPKKIVAVVAFSGISFFEIRKGILCLLMLNWFWLTSTIIHYGDTFYTVEAYMVLHKRK